MADRVPPGARPLRVLYLIDSLGHGGAERVLLNTCRELARLGVDVHVGVLQTFDGNPVARKLEADGVPVATLGIQRLRDPRGYGVTRNAVVSAAPDIVHTHLEFSNVLGTIAAWRCGIPSVATLHTLDTPRRFSRAWIRFTVMAYVLRRFASLVVAVSESTRDHHLHVSGLQSERVVVIPNGTDLAPYTEISTATRAAIRAELAIPSDAPVIMTVAIQRSEKGLHHMITAMPAVRARHPRALYVLVGDGPERAALERRVALLNLADAIRFTGLRDDVPAMLSAADVFVQPSLSDALPTTLIEAMAAGVPAVGTNVGGIPEIISPGRTGVLVPPGSASALADAVLGLLDDTRTARRFGDEARQVAFSSFDAGHAVRRLYDEYLNLTNGRG